MMPASSCPQAANGLRSLLQARVRPYLSALVSSRAGGTTHWRSPQSLIAPVLAAHPARTTDSPALGQPDGHRRLRIHRVRGARPEGDGRNCSNAWASSAIARHRHKNVLLVSPGRHQLHRQRRARSFAQRFARQHGPSICAIAFRVQDAKAAYERALELGAWGYADQAGPGELNIPAIKGIGDSLIYLVDRWRGKNGAQEGDIGNIGFYDVDFEALPGVDARGAEPARPRPDLHRPPDAQRAPRPHGRVGRLLRAPVQLPRDPLLRHRGPGDRREEQGA